IILFCVYRLLDQRALPSFPTRRSSDLWASKSDSATACLRVDSNTSASRLTGLTLAQALMLIWMRSARRSTEWLSHSGLASGDRSDRKSTRLNSSHVSISYAVFCLQKQK